MKPKGWRGESRRHSMARKGISTARGKYLDVKELQKQQRGLGLDDFHIEADLDENDNWIYYLSTPDDRSVGIFGYAISPEFEDVNGLKLWWEMNAEKVLDIWYSDIMDGQELYEELQKVRWGGMTEKAWREYDLALKQGKEYTKTGDVRAFRKDSRLESLKSSGKPNYKYHTVIVDIASHTFSTDVINSDKELPSSEELGWFGYGKRFSTKKEQQEFIDYLKKEGKFIEEKELD